MRKLAVLWLALTSLALASTAPDTYLCDRNLQHLAIRLKSYAREHEGRYPARLELLVPAYIPAIPRCPVSGTDTYTPGYKRVTRGYGLCCASSNHAFPFFPAVDSALGPSVAPRANTVRMCQARLVEAVGRLEHYHATHGSYPPALQYRDLGCLNAGYFQYDRLHGGFLLRCPGAAHLGERVPMFEPAFDTEHGYSSGTLLPLPAELPRPRSAGHAPYVKGITLGLALLFLVTRRPR